MQPFKTECIILRRTNYGEADRIVNFLTPEHGKLSAIAKGVRRPKSKLAGGLELFAVCEVTILPGRGDMGMVTSSRLKRFFGAILRDYERMQCGYEAVRLINRAAQTVSEPDFYELLRDVFGWLDDTAIDWRLSETSFRLKLQALLGHGLNLRADRSGQKLAADTHYDYDFAENAFFEHAKGRFGSGHIKLLRLAHTKNPAVLRQVAGLEPILDDCVWLVRTAES